MTLDNIYSLGLSLGVVLCFALGFMAGKDLM